ncbi:hypothetical protein ACQP1G_30750 [Nocardia sp. CA-107356]|uniref:hypothetical protein n=1 Tax=Nocardia sp. CA-107356 TaxID=3239972 RepID=UPI003D8EDCAD
MGILEPGSIQILGKRRKDITAWVLRVSIGHLQPRSSANLDGNVNSRSATAAIEVSLSFGRIVCRAPLA